MFNRFSWNAFWRPDSSSPWQWGASGVSHGAANLGALLRFPPGETVVLFGRVLPDRAGAPRLARRAAR